MKGKLTFSQFLIELFDYNNKEKNYKQTIDEKLNELYDIVMELPSLNEKDMQISDNYKQNLLDFLDQTTDIFVKIADQLKNSENPIEQEYVSKKIENFAKQIHNTIFNLKHSEQTVENYNKFLKKLVEDAQELHKIILQ